MLDPQADIKKLLQEIPILESKIQKHFLNLPFLQKFYELADTQLHIKFSGSLTNLFMSMGLMKMSCLKYFAIVSTFSEGKILH